MTNEDRKLRGESNFKYECPYCRRLISYDFTQFSLHEEACRKLEPANIIKAEKVKKFIYKFLERPKPIPELKKFR